MNLPTMLRALTTSALFAVLASGQDRPPPWWGVQHEVGISLFWNFDTPFLPGLPPAPSAVVASASWYNPAETAWTAPSNMIWIPTLNGHTGVLGMVGNGSGTSALLKLKVDNDPHYDWVKIFWFQFDALEGSSGSIERAIEKDLAQYKRTSVEQYVEPLGGGWERVTIKAQLYPQPNDETISWRFLEGAFGTIGIDNLYVNSKCIQPGADKDGKALGERDGGVIDLTAATGGAVCSAVAVTQGPGPAFVRTYWVGANATSPGQPHAIVRLNQAGTQLGATTLPDTTVTTPDGPGDLAVADLGIAPGVTQTFVYALVDRRPSGGNVVLRAVDLLGVLTPARDVVLAGFPLPPGQPFGLAFEPTGNLGNGSFWITGNDGSGNGQALEWSRNGTLIDGHAVPAGCAGLGYDEALGNFYGFSRATRPSPLGPVQVNGFEWSNYDHQLTGVEFCGDLTIPNGTGPRGGLAGGLHAYRPKGPATSELRLVCVVDVPAQGKQLLYELAAPFGFGWSQFGRMGMAGGPPFVGNSGWQVKLFGVPEAIAAVFVIGFSNTTDLGVPLPIDLTPNGLPESMQSVSADIVLFGIPPSGPGEFTIPLPVPLTPTLGYATIYTQFVVLDPSVLGLYAGTQAGKTVVYP